MKKGLYVILIFLVIVSITGIAIAARPDPMTLPSKGPIGDLKMRIENLLAVNTNLQTQIDQLTADKTALLAENADLTEQLMLCKQLSEQYKDNWKMCELELCECSEVC